MSSLDQKTQEDLETIWNSLNEFWTPDNSWKEEPKRSTISQKICHFSATHSDDSEYIDRVVKGVTRGVRLLESAIAWQEPFIGNTTASRRKIDKLRGNQWRLVMAYVGFEITCKTLMRHEQRSTDLKVIEEFIRKCHPPEYLQLESPERKKNLEKWLSKAEGELAKFLGVTGGDLKILSNWIDGSEPIQSWLDAVKLAKAIRNASAHGFLSATKVDQWKLKPAIRKLTNDLAEIVMAGLRQLL